MKRDIPNVLKVEFNRQIVAPGPYAGYTDRTQGYNYCLLVCVPDREALQVYDAHPAHIAVKLVTQKAQQHTYISYS